MGSRAKKSDRKPVAKPGVWAFLIAIVALAAAFIFYPARQKTGPASDQTAARRFTQEPAAAVFATYAGSQSCRECHLEAFKLWESSHHALAERALNPTLDQPAFDPTRTIQHGSQSSETRFSDGRFEIVTSSHANERNAFPVERVIGVAPLKQFLVPSAGGRFQVTELAVDTRRGDWFDIFGDEDRKPGEWGHWTGRGMTWNVQCAACHNTRVRKNYNESTDTYATAMAERSVGCEACHGPMASHVAWQQKRPQPAKGDPTVRRFDKDQMLSTCGSCHARRAELTGDFRPGKNFFDHYALTIPDDTDLFYADGQVREENYEFTSFLSSRMHAAGVRCGDCHQPHSAKLLATDNSLCMRCHATPVPPAPRVDPTSHTHHLANAPGDRCVDCHMPQTSYMQRHARSDHGFTIPDPLLTRQHGIPNACNRCHKDRSNDWALEAVEKWYGSRMERPSRTRALWIAQARAGQRGAAENLLKLAREETIPLWRAAATGLLKHVAAQTNVTAVLLEHTKDTEPLVRIMAARALEPVATLTDNSAVSAVLQKLLADPVRAVRMEAAWALRASVTTNSPAGQDLLHYLHHNCDQPSGLLQTGIFHLDRGDIATAFGHFHRAVNWDPASPALRQALAVSLSLQGRNDEAVLELEAACRLAPREAEYHFKLGLALNEVGKLSEAVAALQKAVKLDAQFTQAWYNLGLAFSALENPEGALEALARAESVNSNFAAAPYARATILARLGRIAEARTAARRALEIQPNFSEAAALLQTLSLDAK